MLILKTPDNVVYCTINKDSRRIASLGYPTVCPLGLVLDVSVYDFLLETFGKAHQSDKHHPLFNYGTSQYHVINFLCTIQ